MPFRSLLLAIACGLAMLASDIYATTFIKTAKHSKVTLNDSVIVLDTAAIYKDVHLKAMIHSFEKETTTDHFTKKEIPPFLLRFFEKASGITAASIANPGEQWNSTDDVDYGLPKYQLAYFGLGNDLALLSLCSGGTAPNLRHVIFIQFKKEKIVDVWCDHVFCGANVKKDLIEAIKKRGKRLPIYPKIRW